MPASPSNEPHYVFHLPRKALRIGAIAFGIGLLLFVLVWWSGRDNAFYTAPTVEPGAAQSQTEPLPEPLPAGEAASDMPRAGAPTEQRPQLVEAPVAELPPEPIDEGAVPDYGPGPDPAPGAPVIASAVDQPPVPLRDSTPAPDYPPSALRRRQGGTVLVRVEVDASGRPAGVALVQRSGSTDLDRAAMEAVREWRFQPAQRDGQPVPGSLVIPVDFRVE